MNPANLTIRNATIEDARAVGSMVDEFRTYLHGLGDLGACVNFGSEQYRRDGFGDNAAFQGLIAETDGEVAGYALYAADYSTDTGSRTLFLHDLFVKSSFRGQRIGEALMSRLREIARAGGYTAIHWLVWHTNESAIGFYERIGAKTIDTVKLMRLDIDTVE
jgi:ribosomal protein S18 acetylase RimI-like enzyme